MKFLLLLLLAVPSFGQSIKSQVDKFKEPHAYLIRYDKFAKETTVEYQCTIKGGFHPLETTIAVNIPDEGKRSYYFYFTNHNYETLYNHDHLRFLLDGIPLEIADETNIDYMAGFVLTPDEWQKLVLAKTVEMQLHGFEAKFSDKLLTALHNLDSLKLPGHPPL